MISLAVALSCAAFLAQPRTLSECAGAWGVKRKTVYGAYIYIMRHAYLMRIVTKQRPGRETTYQVMEFPHEP